MLLKWFWVIIEKYFTICVRLNIYLFSEITRSPQYNLHLLFQSMMKVMISIQNLFVLLLVEVH